MLSYRQAIEECLRSEHIHSLVGSMYKTTGLLRNIFEHVLRHLTTYE